MPDDELVREITDATLRLISASRSGDVQGEEVARDIGRDPDDVDLYYAFREAERRGSFEVVGWAGGMGLPLMIRLHPDR
jgi:hypothetical protein